MGYQALFALFESWALASCVTNFKLPLKTATLFMFVTAICYSNITLVCIDNQHLFLLHHAAVFIATSGGKMD